MFIKGTPIRALMIELKDEKKENKNLSHIKGGHKMSKEKKQEEEKDVVDICLENIRDTIEEMKTETGNLISLSVRAKGNKRHYENLSGIERMIRSNGIPHNGKIVLRVPDSKRSTIEKLFGNLGKYGKNIQYELQKELKENNSVIEISHSVKNKFFEISVPE